MHCEFSALIGAICVVYFIALSLDSAEFHISPKSLRQQYMKPGAVVSWVFSMNG